MKIISDRRTETETYSKLNFDRFGERCSGFAFPCDENGKVDVASLPDCARENYRKLIFGELPEYLTPDNQYIEPYVTTYTATRRIPAIGECSCGRHVELSGFTNTCERCGKDYNSAGQELSPREQWGEETGEHWADIVNTR